MSRQFTRNLSSSRSFRFAAAFDRLFLGLLDVLASLNLLSVVLFPAGLGALFVIGGCVYEQSAQIHMLHSGGVAVLDTYLALVQSHQLSLGEFLVASVTGHCYSVSAVWQGIGWNRRYFFEFGRNVRLLPNRKRWRYYTGSKFFPDVP